MSTDLVADVLDVEMCLPGKTGLYTDDRQMMKGMKLGIKSTKKICLETWSHALHDFENSHSHQVVFHVSWGPLSSSCVPCMLGPLISPKNIMLCTIQI